MLFARLFTIAVIALPSAFSIPLKRVLDSATLLQNAQNAQVLNKEFSTLTKDSPCDAGQTACVSGALAECQFGSWKLTKCSDTQQCFAIPSLTSKGTTLTCTSKANALSIINGAGAEGDVAAPKDSDATVSFPTTSSQSNSTQSALPSGTSPSASAPSPSATPDSQTGVQVVTVTITQILPPPISTTVSTTTLDGSGVTSLFSSLSSSGATIVSSSIAAEPTGSSNATATLASFSTASPAATNLSSQLGSSSVAKSSSSSSFAVAATILLTTHKAVATPVISTSSVNSPSTTAASRPTGYTRNYSYAGGRKV